MDWVNSIETQIATGEEGTEEELEQLERKAEDRANGV